MSATNCYTNSASPGTYNTGGFTVATGLSAVAGFDVAVAVKGANLGQVAFTWSASGGTVTVKILSRNYSLLSFGAVTGLPAGVSAQSSSGQTVASEAAHTHDATHDHAISAASGTMTGASGLVTQAVTGGVNTSTHTHTVDLPSFSLTSGAGSSHNHTWDNIYQHQHTVTQATTDIALAELANGTDLSGTTLIFVAVDK